jgi:hypothetical protein
MMLPWRHAAIRHDAAMSWPLAIRHDAAIGDSHGDAMGKKR